MCQILVFNAINTIITDRECNIRIDRLPLGRGTEQWKWYCPRLSFPLVNTTTFGQSVYPVIALHISDYYIIIDIYGRGNCINIMLYWYLWGILYKYHALLISMGDNCINIMPYWYLHSWLPLRFSLTFIFRNVWSKH